MPPPSDLATHWPISGQSALIQSTSQELFLLALFWKSSESESTQSAAKKNLSLSSSPTDIPAWKIFTEDMQLLSTSYTHKRTSSPASHTSYLLQWHTFYKLENQRTTYNTKKNLFLLWLKFTSAIRINLLFLCFKEVSLSILYYKSIYSDMETNHKH